MKCELRIVSGSRAGHRDVFDRNYIGIGRHPMSDVRFDAEKDLDASTRHAAIVKNGDVFVLRDLGSTNGTFVNGEKLTQERALKDGDTLRFGVHGPEVSFHLLRDEGEEVVMEAVHLPANAPKPPSGAHPKHVEPVHPATPAAAPAAAAAPAHRPPSKTSELRAEIQSQRSRYRALAVTVIVIVLGAIGIVVLQGRASNSAIQGAQRAVDSLSSQVAALERLAAKADSEKSALRAELSTERDPAKRRALQSRYDSVSARASAIQQAQTVDFTAIINANDRAVAMVFVKFPDSSVVQGTAFSVSSSGQLFTNKHVVTSEHGERPREIAVQFSGSTDVLPARLVRVSADADIALLQLESRGPFPQIAGIATQAAAAGEPIMLIGFPGGAGDGTPHATPVGGYVTRVAPDSLYELDAFSGTGASGSPIFDRAGRTIGIEFGGLAGRSGRGILGLPIGRAQALLASH